MGWIVADNAKVHKNSQKKGADAEEKKGKKEEKEKEKKEEKEKEEPPQPPQQPSLGWRDPLGPLPTHWQCHICEHFNNYLKHGGTLLTVPTDQARLTCAPDPAAGEQSSGNAGGEWRI